MSKTLRQQSKTEYSAVSDRATAAEIKTGSMQRIADSLETIAKSKTDLEEKAERYDKWYQASEAKNAMLLRTLSALRGHNTRLKNALSKATT